MLFITQFEHNRYQIEAEYLSYLMISIISLLSRNSKKQVVKSKKILIFHHIFLNLHYSLNIIYRLFKFGVCILDVIMEGKVSQIFYLGPGSYLMWF